MLIAIDTGHNCPPDIGARGIAKSEDYLNLQVVTKLIPLLSRQGINVVLTLPKTAKSVNDSLRQRVIVANSKKADLFVSIHHNALNGKAYGSEVFVTDWANLPVASNVLSNITKKMGFFNRGVKLGNFYVLQKTVMPAILVECCFCDNINDMSRWNADLLAVAIADGLTG